MQKRKKNILITLIVIILVSVLVTGIVFFCLNKNDNIVQIAKQDTEKLQATATSLGFTKVNGGGSTTLTIDTGGNLWAWGQNTRGLLGNGTNTNSKVPVQIKSGTTFKEIDVAIHTLAVDSSGNLWAWGANDSGQLGNGVTGNDVTSSYITQTVPVQIKSGTKFSKVSAGNDHSLAIDESGNLWSWGANDWGQLGNGGSSNSTNSHGYKIQTEPVQIKSGTKFSKIAAGNAFSLAIDTSGNLWAWGRNEFGQLGNNGSSNSISSSGKKTQTEPVQIKSGTKFTEISAGFAHSLAIDTNGNLWAWGANDSGPLGNGLTSDSNVPIQIKVGTRFSKVSAGGTSSFAIDANGNLWAWGNNFSGQLGIGSRDDYITTPVQVMYGTSFAEIKMGNYEGLAIDTNGKLWGCGSGANGSLTEAGRTYSFVQIPQIAVTLNNGSSSDTSKIKAIYNATMPDITIPSKTGYTFEGYYTGQNGTGSKYYTNTGASAQDWDSMSPATLYAKWMANSYTVTFNTNGGTINDTNYATSYQYGNTVTLPTNVTKTGYSFAGWFNNVECAGTAITEITSTDSGNKEFFAKWTTTSGTEYNIHHYKQKLDKTGYELAEIEPKTGTTNASVTAEPKNYTGFTVNYNADDTVTTGNVSADGTLILKLYYDRNKYSISLDTDDDGENEEIEYTYGEEIDLPIPSKPGYTFDGWFDNEDLDGDPITKINPEDAGNIELYPKWTPNTDTPYTIKHYVQNLTKTGYELEEEESKEGTTDTLATASAKTYKGFTYNPDHPSNKLSGHIVGDGTLVLELYYTRNTYSVTLDIEDGILPDNNKVIEYTYGEIVDLPIPEKEGFIFGGWYENEDLTGDPVTKINSNDDGNKEFYVKWTKEDEYYITSQTYLVNTTDNYIMKVNPYTTIQNFINKINTNGTKTVVNAQKQAVDVNSLVGTGFILQVNFKGTIYEYAIAVRGDLDGNGKITVTDLSMMNQALVKNITLTGMREKAADIDYSKNISSTDLSMLNQKLVGKIEL